MRIRRLPVVGLLMGVLPFHVTSAAELVDGDGALLVRGHCSACHSLRLVTAQRGDRQYWQDTIRWMQRTQNLWPIPADQEAQILDYLAQHYNESEWGRRPPLSPALMPMLEQKVPAQTATTSDSTR